jgi:two-component system alkaline phosphatase synthesis response regulator PhoP
MEKKGRILVVDDERLIVAMIKDLLEINQYEVLTALDGEEGLNRARSAQPDLIILDIMLPKLDGLKVCRLLKFDLKYRHIPILMLSARAGEADREVSLQSGANAYMVKPFSPKSLLANISELLKGRDSSSPPLPGGNHQ